MASNAEHTAVERNFTKAVELLSKTVDLSTFANDLADAGFMERDCVSNITGSVHTTKLQQARALIEIVSTQVKHDHQKFRKYQDLLKRYRSLHRLEEDTRKEYDKLQASPEVCSKRKYVWLKEQKEATDKELQVKKEELKQIEAEKEKRDLEIENMRDKISSLKCENERMLNKIQCLETDMEERKDAMKSLKDAEKEYKRLQLENKDLRKEVTDFENKLESNNREFKSLCTMLIQKSKSKAEMSDKVRFTSKDIQNIQDAISNSLQLQELEKQLQTSDRHIYEQVRLTLNSKEKDVEGYKKRLDEIEEEIDGLTKELEKCMSELEYQTKSLLRDVRYELKRLVAFEANELLNTLSEAQDEKQMTLRQISNAEESINNLKEMIKKNLEADPSKCVAVGPGTRDSRINSTATFTVLVRDSNNRPCAHPPCELAITMCSMATQSFVETTVSHKDLDEAEYEVRYTATQRGRYQLNVKMNGRDIQRSPFTVCVRKSPKDISPRASVISKVRLNHPVDIAVSSNSEIVVCEQEAHKVSVITKEGKMKLEIGGMGCGTGEFHSPCAVAVNEIHIFVSDRENHRIQKFTRGGDFVMLVGGLKEGNGNRQFNSPSSLKLYNSKIYVCDTLNYRTQVFDTEFNLISSECRNFSSDGLVNIETDSAVKPCDISFDTDSNWYVADQNHGRVIILDQHGNTISENLIGLPILNIYVDFDLIYVREEGKNRLSVYDISDVGKSAVAECKFICRLGKRDIRRNLRGFTVDGEGTVYVCDSSNHCIVYYK